MLDKETAREASGAPAPPRDDPTAPALATDPAPVEDRLLVASQRQLIWWRFRKHKLALGGAVVVLLFYLVALGGDFFAYADPNQPQGDYLLVPPRGLALHVHPLRASRDPVTLQPIYAPDTSQTVPLRLFAHGYRYKLLGLISTDIHLIGTSAAPAGTSLFILGSDEEGRDVFSRLVLATRTSLFIGLLGVALSVVIGATLGGLSGYYGGWVDTVVQRLIEIVTSLPTIPLWMGLAASVPRGWSVERTYFLITLIISLIGWAGLARVVRGRFLQVRHEDFVLAAELVGARPRRLIFVHMLPLFTSHIIASITLAIPLMIIAETALSFLGLGLHPPAVSWGVMLQQAQNLQSVANSPWMMLPVIPVVVAILAFNFVGDGLRDAADPYD
jgi:peptide/nickel transport system permease protein